VHRTVLGPGSLKSEPDPLAGLAIAVATVRIWASDVRLWLASMHVNSFVCGHVGDVGLYRTYVKCPLLTANTDELRVGGMIRDLW